MIQVRVKVYNTSNLFFCTGRKLIVSAFCLKKRDYYFKYPGKNFSNQKCDQSEHLQQSRWIFCKYFGGRKDGYNRPGYSRENSICERRLLDGKYLAGEQPLKIISCFQKKEKQTHNQALDSQQLIALSAVTKYASRNSPQKKKSRGRAAEGG